MKTFNEIIDNTLRNELKEMRKGLELHMAARLMMMMLEDKGIFIEYEEAIKFYSEK
jgi:hypothetical protein